ncbi:MAG: alpha/beta hydrolase [Candidatus Eisenbacteria bacterium]|uniref:Alpha/beta hydrolase n=1 Tax=Eiseniibacteriota bacterium TaxID=2212470 RepID=A0A933W3B5_UNCEI|nr:alpha/beta hydrolase [Candidatus Eisenbacteria bacterium]
MRRSLFPLLLIAAALTLLVSRDPRTSAPPHALGAFGRGPTVVLVHGLGSRATHWLGVARDLARDHRVVLAELPGHGLASMPAQLALEDAALSLDRQIAEYGDEPVVLVGHSVGGLVAAAEALRSPSRVRALVLVETALRPQLGPADREALLSSLESDYAATLDAVYGSFGRDSAQGASLAREAALMEPAVMRTWVRLAMTTDLSGRARELRVPLLVVLSERSWPEDELWPACADSLGYAGLASAEPVRLEGTGHFVMLDRPQALAGAIRRFARGGLPELALAGAR